MTVSSLTPPAKKPVIGNDGGDLTALIGTLATKQHEYDVREATGAPHDPESEHVHEKMVMAARNLKEIAVNEAKREGKELPEFSVVLGQRPGKEAGKVVLDLRIEGLMDRKNAQPVMGALTRAFHRRKNRGFSHGIVQEDHHEFDLVADDQHLHAHTGELHPSRFEHLVNNLSRPLNSISGATASLLGMVNEQLIGAAVT